MGVIVVLDQIAISLSMSSVPLLLRASFGTMSELENPNEFKKLYESENLIIRVLRESKLGTIGFSYKQGGTDDGIVFCLRCAVIPHSYMHQANESHCLFYDAESKSHYNACGKHKDREGLRQYNASQMHSQKNIFIKFDIKYKYKDHPHPLTFVQKIDCHPIYEKCGKPYQDLILECEDMVATLLVIGNTYNV
ncbi:hypothetical protein Goklo_022576 [Gossypium klotzschianum]|uniref:Uncharacterized protein n=1 Tax=Gossypium klotzschianum TaxID=34286 RepID=A0A7J8TN37_9ROSI|nr:hypothetical protein [Gossypium klotzschianum]